MKRIANYLIALAVAAFTFTSCADVPSPFGDIVKPDSGDVVVIEPSGTGTEADPYNVAGVLEYISGLGADTPSPKEVYIKGYAVELTDISASYGNATFTISDNAEGTANKFTAYRAAGLGNQKVTDESFIKQGDIVVICGKVTNYKGNTPRPSRALPTSTPSTARAVVVLLQPQHSVPRTLPSLLPRLLKPSTHWLTMALLHRMPMSPVRLQRSRPLMPILPSTRISTTSSPTALTVRLPSAARTLTIQTLPQQDKSTWATRSLSLAS